MRFETVRLETGRAMRRAGPAAAMMLLALGLSACGSARFGEGGPTVAARTPTGPVYGGPSGTLEPTPAAPAGSVTSEPLAPPPGSGYPPPAPGYPGSGPVVADVPPPIVAERPIVQDPPPRIANAAPSRQTVLGTWSAQDASGSCRVQLSSAPALDLYRASASACGNRDLARVTSWDFREGEVFLYQPGGTVAARLRPAGSALEGVLAKSGAPLTLSR